MRRTGQGVLREARGVSRTDTVGDLTESLLKAIAAGTLRQTMNEVQARKKSGLLWRWIEEGTTVRAAFSVGGPLDSHDVVISHQVDPEAGGMVVEVDVGGQKKQRRFDPKERVGVVADGTASLLEELVGKGSK